MRYRSHVDVACDPAEVFAYLADFSHTSDWDPGIAESRRLTDGPTAVGSRFEVVAVFRGNRQRFEYTVTELEAGRRIALHGEGEKATSEDVITVEPQGAGTRVRYEAIIRLKGVLRVVEPFLGGTFRKLGDDALAGLQVELGPR